VSIAQFRVAESLLAALMALLLQRLRLVEHEAARPGEAAHLAPLFAGGHQFVPEGLEALHGNRIRFVHE
jgi:hypothetical protein